MASQPESPVRTRSAHRPEAEPSRQVPIAAAVVFGVVIRVAWLLAHRHLVLAGDPFYYHHEANLVASGYGFIAPTYGAVPAHPMQTAVHPPLYVLYLALWSLLGARSVLWHLVASSLLGSASVYVLAITGRRLGGDRVGVICGFLAAVAPNLWVWDGLLYSETMAIFTVAVFLYFVVRYLGAPSRSGLLWVAGAGALCGLARSELAIVILAVVPLALRTEPFDRARAVRQLAGCVGVVAVVLAPWAIYNQTRFHHTVPLSNGLGLVTVSSTCDTGWYGPFTGYWSFQCSLSGTEAAAMPTPRGVTLDESDLDQRMRKVSEHYVEHHLSRVPAVVGARLGRVTGLYRPVQQAQLNSSIEAAAPLWLAGMIMSTWYVFAGFAIAGGVALRRAGVPLLAICLPILSLLLTTVFTYGLGRFRAPSEASVMLLAAIGVDYLVRRRLEAGAEPEADCVLAAFARREPESASSV